MSEMTLDQVLCECCGTPASLRPVDIDFARNVTTILCSLCKGLIKEGMIRSEGNRRYRRWNFEWTPGELLPEVEL